MNKTACTFPLELNEDIFKLKPVCKKYIWGGKKLIQDYHKSANTETVAETWELSSHEQGVCEIASGVLKGINFVDFLQKADQSILGKKCMQCEKFPLLIKLIDAQQALSIQVHPDDSYALKNENEYGKAEMWYVIDCEEDAFIYYGFKKNVTQKEIEQKLNKGTFTDLLNKVRIQKGNVIYIAPGIIHALGPGVLVYEIQQNSNCTYRVYDYNRTDEFGNQRELHLNKAFQVLNFHMQKAEIQTIPEEVSRGYKRQCLLSNKYFVTEKYEVIKQCILHVTSQSFLAVTVIDGCGLMKGKHCILEVQKGDTMFITAGEKDITIIGNCECLLSHI